MGAEGEAVFDAARAGGVVDIGCGDGEISFLFEQLGFQVTSIDHPSTNHNGMQGVRALKRLLGSGIEIREADLDEGFSLPAGKRSVAMLLGVLYHIKNPFRLMEQLAKQCEYCFLSTRVARRWPDGSPMPANQPIAYLLDADELNADESNYWIFSHAGLDRLLRRTHWTVVESFSIGETEKSDPSSLVNDERVFSLLRSRYGLSNVELVDGWYDVEGSGWRWTKQRFSLRVRAGARAIPERITLRSFLPLEMFNRLGPLTLSASLNGQPLKPMTMSGAGDHTYASRFGSPLSPESELLFTFELDKSLHSGPDDSRDLGIIVASIDFD